MKPIFILRLLVLKAIRANLFFLKLITVTTMTSTDKDIKSATKSKGPLTAATQAVRAEIASILKIDVDRSQWEVTDSIPEKGLYMVHYTDGADMTKYGHVRGTVIDVERKYVVAKSFGFSPIATISSLAASAGGDLVVKDDTGNCHDFKAGNYSLRRGFEGVILRIFKHDGVVYTATHRRLNIEKSRWGNSTPFIQMYKDLKGPEPDSLFDKSKAFSPYCWVFIITHPELLVGTKQNVGPGYVVLLGVETMFDATTKPEAVKADDYQTAYQLPVMQEESTLNSVVTDTKSGDGKDAKDRKSVV
jgi:hypothetical protein